MGETGHRHQARLSQTVAVVAATVLLTGCAAARETDATPDAASGQSPTATARHDGHDEADLGAPASTPPPAAAADLVGRFARAWARPDLSAEQWWAGVAPLCTDEMAGALRSTDPGAIPASKVTGTPTRVRDGQSPAYTVATDAGTLTVTVTPRAEKGWAVSDIDFGREAR